MKKLPVTMNECSVLFISVWILSTGCQPGNMKSGDTETQSDNGRDSLSDTGIQTDSSTDSGQDADAGNDSEADTDTADSVTFPFECTFDSDWDGFESSYFIHNADNGTLELDYTFISKDDPDIVTYRDFYAQDWTGVESIEIRLRSVEFITGGYTIVFLSGYGWSWCSMFVSHTETTDWTVITMDLDKTCGSSLYENMAQEFAIVVTPGDDAVFPEAVKVEVDSVTVRGTVKQ